VFIAAYPPPAVVDALAAAARALELPAHRPTPPEQVHLTLQFVGDVDPRDLDGLIESAERASAGVAAFEVAPERLVTLPERGPARLVAAAAPPVPALAELVSRLAARLAREPIRGPYLPHLTLLRFRAPVRGLAVDHPIAAAPFAVGSIAVMRSLLGRGGAEHRELREIRLGG
jgi:2'-5' RNA ligase